MAEMKKRFLDYAGLSKFWTIIDTKFAPKVDAASMDHLISLQQTQLLLKTN